MFENLSGKKNKSSKLESQYINELYPNRILRVNFSDVHFALETAEIKIVASFILLNVNYVNLYENAF